MTVPESISADKPRLVRVELKPISSSESLAITPRGQKFRVNAPIAELWRVLEACDGYSSFEEILATSSNPDGFREVLEVLAEDNVLCTALPVTDEVDWVRFGEGDFKPERLQATEVLLYGDDHLLGLMRTMPLMRSVQQVTPVPFGTLSEVLSTSQGQLRMLLVARTHLDVKELGEIDELCERLNVSWTQFHTEQGKGYVGPAIVPHRTSNYRDLLMRRHCAADYEDLILAELMAGGYGAYTPPGGELLWMLSWWLMDVERWWVGGPTRMLSTEIELDPVNYSLKWFTVLPAPERELKGEFISSAAKDPWILVNKRAGIVIEYRQIEHHPAVPAGLVTIQTDVADMSRHYTWANNTVCGGSAFDDFEGARNAAIGEAVERYCGNCVDHRNLVRGSYEDFIAAGEAALDPESLVLYSQRQYAAKGFPFKPFTRKDIVSWARGRSLTRNAPIWIPASLVYVNWYTDEFDVETPKNFLNYPGIAAGTSLDMALSSAIEEIVERDATMIWWTNRQALPSVQLTPKLEAVWNGTPRELGQRVWLVHLDNEFGIPVIAGVVENTKDKLLNVGFAARPDPEQAALKAWTEALTLQEGSRDLDLPDGLLRGMIATGEFHADLKNWRADRHYLDDYRPDYHDVNDLMCQQQVFLDPRATELVRPWLDTPTTRTMAELPRLRDRSLTSYRAAVEGRGYEIFYVDITSPDVAASGLKVVRALIPGLAPNFPAAFPFLGKGRLQQAPVDLGWRAAPLREEELNLFPLPHA